MMGELLVGVVSVELMPRELVSSVKDARGECKVVDVAIASL
jgi:hypothetical protein